MALFSFQQKGWGPGWEDGVDEPKLLTFRKSYATPVGEMGDFNIDIAAKKHLLGTDLRSMYGFPASLVFALVAGLVVRACELL